MVSKITSFVKEVKLEMKKVNWPNRQETLRYVLIVLGASFVVAALLGLFDFLIQQVLNKVI
jgi:preprotein translocase subunit SecE